MALTHHERRMIAVTAGCDPRCVARYLDGRPLRTVTRLAIERALAQPELRFLVEQLQLGNITSVPMEVTR